jgi:very-short-patch-repair endonuclease
MASQSAQRMAWELAEAQHWVITRGQLLGLGFSPRDVDIRIRKRLHPVRTGVFAVGRPHLTREGHLMAAVLACGEGAALSHFSAAELYEICRRWRGPVHVSVRTGVRHPRRPAIAVHRRRRFDVRIHKGIPATSPICTIIDIASALDEVRLERAINEAVNRDLIELGELHDAARGRASAIVRLLDRDMYVVTDTRLEQALLRIVRKAGLPVPQTQRRLPGGRVDFYWPELKLVVEADSLRFHRTPAQQATDLVRDQKHAAADLTTLRFSHWQIMHDPDYVAAILTAVISRLAAAA